MRTLALSELAESIDYGVTASATSEPVGPKFLRITDIQNGTVEWQNVPFCEADRRKLNSAELKSGDIVFARTGATTGKSFLIRECPADAVFASYLIRVRPGKAVDSGYLAHFFQSDGYWDQISLMAEGAAQPGVNSTKLAQLEVPIPLLDQQRRIAAILDQADELRRKRKRALDCLGQLGQAIFMEMFGDPASNPKGFEAKPLGEVIEFIGGSQPAKSHFLYEPGPDRVRFVQIRDFRTDKYPTYVPKALAKRPFSEDDVMIGRYGPPVFQIFRGLSGTYNVALMKAKPRRNLTSDFIFYLLQEPRLHSYVVANSERTAGQSGVNLELLEKYPAFEPPTTLLEAFSRQIATLDSQLLAARRAAERADLLFASLQHRAFRGELNAASFTEAAE